MAFFRILHRRASHRPAAGRFAILSAMLAGLLLLTLAGCTSIQLTSDYDQQTDQSLHQLQQDVESLLTKLERESETDASSYGAYETQYDSIRVALRTLRVRASSRPKNQTQVDQLGNVLGQLDLFEQAHQEGISAEEIPIFRRGFDQSFRAMITLELARKRGESEN